MNESQERREELLRMSRQKWRKGSIPAVHPRYQHVYRGLYGEHSSEENGGSSFFARMFISFLIFGMMPVEIDALREKLMKEYEEGEKPERKKRILLTGCPSSGAPMKVVKAIEEHGGNVVVYENCGGAKSVDRLIDEDAEDIYKAIAERYLAIGCSVMTPDNNRIELMGRLLEEYNIEGVVEMTLQACHTYNIEAKSIEKFVKSKGLPYIHVETDYSQADIGQLDTRIAAFLEMI